MKDFTREQQAELLKIDLAKCVLDNPKNPIHTLHVQKEIFIEMAILFIAKHGK